MFVLSAALLAAMAAEGMTQPLTIHLICSGGGAANKGTVTTGYAQNNYGGAASAQVYGQTAVGFNDQVNIDLIGDSGRIRMPRTMLPVIRGGKDGWFDLKNLKISDGEITASAAINPINSPKVRLDRITGHLSISGKAGSYSGLCEPYDPRQVQRKF